MEIPQELASSVPFKYAAQVKAGEIVTGKKIQLAIDRFYSWIQDADRKGYVLDHAAGMHVIEFFPLFLKHTKGEHGGKAFHLSPYQQFTLYNIFAWKKRTATGQLVRVIKTVYEKVARKNGKTAVLAGLGLYCQACDGEQGPQIYIGATKKEQAFICWEQAKEFINTSRELRLAGFVPFQRELRTPENNGVFRYLGANSPTMDGLNPSLSIIDEYHAHKDDTVREVLESAMGARLEPLIYIITTAGTNVASFCKLYEDVATEILEGTKEDDSTFLMIHDLDPGDDWEDPENWKKANPNLGISVKYDYLEAEFTKAKNQPSKSPNFKTKHLNQWVDAPEIWIPGEIWRANKVQEIPPEAFTKYGSYAAVDLSTTTDLTAYVILSEPDPEGVRYLKPYFFCPLDTIDRRSKEDRVPYRYWYDAGLLIATPGNTVDYELVQSKILGTYYENGVNRVEFDQWNAAQMANYLQGEGLNISFFSQAIGNISSPTKEFYRLVYAGKIKHDGNPILDWMLAGCVVIRDANDNIKVHKGKSNTNIKRVDGIIASIMALGGSLSIEKTNESKYNSLTVEPLEADTETP